MPDRFRLVYRFPLPPSGNRQSRLGNGHHYTPKRYVAFRDLVKAEAKLQHGAPPNLDSPVGMIVTLPTVRGGGDLDNRCKSLKDAITKAGIWTDDRRCRAELAFFDTAMPKDRCVVTICDLESYWPEVEKLAGRKGAGA